MSLDVISRTMQWPSFCGLAKVPRQGTTTNLKDRHCGPSKLLILFESLPRQDNLFLKNLAKP